jgi:antitoxin ParD1/3/4
MNLSLTPDIQKLIEDRVKSGKYPSPEDVVAAAVAHLEQQERLTSLNATDLDTLFPGLRERLAAGLASANAGRLTDGEAFFDELEREDEQPDSSTRKSA